MAILRDRPQAFCRTIALRQVLGIVTVLGTLACVRPATAAAQAIGTMRVEARVSGAEAEWSSLQLAQQVAGDLSVGVPSAARPSRIELPLSEIQWASPSTAGVPDRRPALIAVHYLRN